MIRDRSGKLLALFVFALLWTCALAAPAARADVYTLTLTNGQSYLSLYPPEEASWDRNMILLHTETGNWIGVERGLIAGVSSQVEVRGHGQRIDATTIYMGRTANANPTPGQEQPVDPQLALLQALYDQQGRDDTYTIEQFVEPGETGRGIPIGFTQQVTPPIGIVPQNPR
jgi:hypothetical protein